MLERALGGRSVGVADTALLLHFDGNYTDSSKYNCPISVGSGMGFSNTAKFDQAAVFTWSNVGTGIQAILPYAIGTQDFTYEVQVYNVPGGGATWGRYFQLGGENTAGLIHLTRYNGSLPQSLLVEYTDATATKIPIIITSSTIAQTTWTHVALTRNAGNWDLWLNGIKATYSTNSPCSYDFPSKTLWIGYTGGQTNDVWSGNMDEIRLTVGKALYTENFTPPVAAFTS